MAETKINIHVKGVPHTIHGVSLQPDGRAAMCICCYNRAYSQKQSFACDNCSAVHIIGVDGTPGQANSAEFEMDEGGMIYFSPDQFTVVKPILN